MTRRFRNNNTKVIQHRREHRRGAIAHSCGSNGGTPWSAMLDRWPRATQIPSPRCKIKMTSTVAPIKHKESMSNPRSGGACIYGDSDSVGFRPIGKFRFASRARPPEYWPFTWPTFHISDHKRVTDSFSFLVSSLYVVHFPYFGPLAGHD
jgi:hypothetical protein